MARGMSRNSKRPQRNEYYHQETVANPTRTINLSEFHRRSMLYNSEESAVPMNRWRGAGIYMLPRALQATVTANIVEIAVDDGNSATQTTQITAPTSATAVDISSLGTLTVSAISTSSATSIVSATSTTLERSVSSTTITASGSTTLAPAVSVLSNALNSTTSIRSTTSNDRTVTVTSTFEVSYSNGTFVASTTTESNSKHSSDASEYSHTATADDATSSTESATATFGGGFTITSKEPSGAATNTLGAAGVASTTSSSASSDPSPSTSDGSPVGPVLTPAQQQVVGGVVGGVAGIALVLVIILYVLRLYRQRLKSQGKLANQAAGRRDLDDSTSRIPSSAMTQTRDSSIIPIGAFASTWKKFRPHSTYTMTTNTSGTLSVNGNDFERGFQRIAGRKIAPVLSHGGDGYGGNLGAFENENDVLPFSNSNHMDRHALAQSSSYHDFGVYNDKDRPVSSSEPNTPTITSFLHPSTGRFHRGETRRPSFSTVEDSVVGAQDFTKLNTSHSQMSLRNNFTNAMLTNALKPDGYAMMRSSPARTPVTQSPSSSTFRLPIQAPVTMDQDAPEMPSSPQYGLGFGHPRDTSSRNLTVEPQSSRMSARSGRSASSGGRFRESIR